MDGSAQGIIDVLSPIDSASGGVGQRYFPRLAEWRATAGSVERIHNRNGGTGDTGGGAGLVAGFHFQRSAKAIISSLCPAAIGLSKLRGRRGGVFVFTTRYTCRRSLKLFQTESMLALYSSRFATVGQINSPNLINFTSINI